MLTYIYINNIKPKIGYFYSSQIYKYFSCFSELFNNLTFYILQFFSICLYIYIYICIYLYMRIYIYINLPEIP